MIREYIEKISEAIYEDNEKIVQISEAIKFTHKNGKRIWILGNGGSLAIAQHMAQDLVKLCGVRAHAPFDSSLITAYSNDSSFEYSFYGPLNVLADKSDIILIFSCSGKSRNYIEFTSFQIARIFSVVGTDGGFLLDKSEICFHVKSDDYQVCETAFCVVADLIIKKLLEDK